MRVPSLVAALVAVPLVLASPVSAQAVDDSVTTFTLANGMKAIVIEDNRAEVVVHMVWYNVGAADEPPGKSGICLLYTSDAADE